MKLFICLSLIAFGFSARAEMAPATSFTQTQVNEPGVLEENQTKFEAIEEWFNEGEALTFEDFRGYYSGRCYMVNAKNGASNAFLIYGSLETRNDGPGFPEDDFKILTIQYNNGRGPADYFDSDERFEENKQDSLQVLRMNWDHISAIGTEPLSYTYDWEANGVADEKHEFVRHNDYIVEKWTAMYPQRYGNIGFKNPGDTLGMCYYFKKF